MLLKRLGRAVLGLCVGLSVAASAHAVDDVSSLERAFQKEFAFLESSKKELTERLQKFRAESDAKANAVVTEVADLEMQLQRLESNIERLNDEVVTAQHLIESNQDNQASLASMYDQANATLGDYGLKLTSHVDYLNAENEGRLATLFDLADEVVATLGSTRQEDGQFFLADGSQVFGSLIKVGNVAAYGVSEMGSGALVPAGEGALRMFEGDTADVATALAAGVAPELMKVFLFESSTQAIEQRPEKTAIDVINSGGIIGWVIVSLGGLAVLMALIRTLYLRSASATNDVVQKQVSELVTQGQVAEALNFCETKKCSTARVVASTLRNIDRDRDHLEDIVSESILNESNNLSRFATFIIVIAAVSPLLGLLGTVTGMITTFDVITEFGTGDPKLLSGGISTALVTTELGLIVAIPTLIVGNLLNAWSNRIKDNMEKAALHVTNLTLGAVV